MSSSSTLMTPVALGSLALSHRIVMAPLTRMRAEKNGLAPRDLAVEMYAQRATEGGLIITEATCISSEAIMDHGVPGIWNEEQKRGWKMVVDAVHAKGGLISMQLWHTGRCAHSSFKDHAAVVKGREPTRGASAVPVPGSTRSTLSGEKLAYTAPLPFTTEEIPRLVDEYRRAALNAKDCGFDAVEVHAAHGYLIDQFLNNGTNQRTDQYGGSIENRSRLLFQVVQAVGTVFPFSRVGVRISPHSENTMKYYGTTDSDPDALYSYVIKELSRFKLAYLFLTEPRWFGGAFDGNHTQDPGFQMGLVNPAKFRGLYTGGKILGAGGFTPSSAGSAVQAGDYDAIAFGRFFISNPDLVDRIARNLPLNPYNRKTFYSHEQEGYTDYPAYHQVRDTSKLVPHNLIGKTLADAKL